MKKTASELMAYILRYSYNTQEINISPESTQRNRQKPDYVVSEILSEDLKPFIFVEIKFDVISPKKVLDQIYEATQTQKYICEPDGSSGILAILLMGTRIVFL